MRNGRGICGGLALATALAGAALATAGGDEAETIAAFVAPGAPTLVCGTLGDARADRMVRAQAGLIRSLVWPQAPLVEDHDVPVARGPEAWPARPLLYGGAQTNAIVRDLAEHLPFEVTEDAVAIAGERFEGEEYRLIALVPSMAAGDDCPGWPQFALYAGAGTPGVEEINNTPDQNNGFLVADRFGALLAGGWAREDGRPVAQARWRGRRLPWRREARALDGLDAEAVILRLELDEPDERDAAEDAAVLAGLRTACAKLGLARARPVEVHLYPDRGSKRSLTGNAGDGHADALSGTLHMLAFDPAVLESVVAHEGTHVLATRALGTAGSAAFGEGLAVWVCGQYGLRALDDWAADPPAFEGDAAAFCGAAFRRLPEGTGYPVAGLLVRALVERAGVEAFLAHLYTAPADGLGDACEAAGLPRDAVDRALAEALRR